MGQRYASVSIGTQPAGPGSAPPSHRPASVERVFESDLIERDLSGLMEAQWQAVEHGDGPLVVIAGAGSGKTRTVVARAQQLLDRGAAPERLCLLTFSRRAAAEMIARLGPAGARVWAGTFHAIGTRFLRLHGRAVGSTRRSA